MNFKKLIIPLLVFALPLTTIGFCVIYYLSPPEPGASAKSFPTVFISLSALTAFYTLCLILILVYLKDKNRDAREHIKSSAHREEDLVRQTHELQNRIELLAAAREIGLILNEDVEFKTILEKVLEITANLVGHEEAEEVTIFLKDEISGKLVPSAQRKDDRTLFDEDLQATQLDWRNVKESFEHGRLFFTADGETLDFTLPLIADRESLGVMQIKSLLEGSQQEKESKTKILQQHLQEFSKMISLAIKTPNLYNRTITDGLTNLFTKQHFLTQLHTFFELTKRYETPLSLIMIDIDHFKSINDNYGHLTGDIVLKEAAALIEQNLRASSSTYRYGGEEIALILPNTNSAGAQSVAERLRKKMEAKRFTSDNGDKIKVTISLGVSDYQKDMVDIRDLIRRADESLYKAKQSGRNQVQVWMKPQEALPEENKGNENKKRDENQ
jgi:diguanylate cyclase (GGDEF)-like protein